MQNKFNEIGRSMVEILGVLAVIGVLSIAGIMGYRYAMDKYQANDIIGSVKMRSSDIWHRYQDKELPNTTEEPEAFDEWSDTTQTGFPITIETIPEIGGFQVITHDIPNGICKQIMNMSTGVIGQDGIKFVNVDTGETLGDIALCEGEGIKSIVFTSFLSETNIDGEEVGECIIDSQCSSVCGESVCDKENGYICSSGCGEKEVCNTETQTCEEIDMCVEGSEFRSKTGACVSCVAKGSYELLSSDEPWIDEALNIEDSLSGKAQCQKCGRTVEEVNGKTYCSTVCLVGKGYVPISGIKNKDSITQYTENDYINGCVSCDNPNDYAINEESAEAVAGCAACGHSTYSTSGIFPATTICGPMSCKSGEFKYFAYKDGSGNIAAQCISCKDTAPRYIHTISKFKTICEAEECNRKAVGKWCVPTSCGTNEFLSASYFYHATNYIESGGCQSCTDTGSYRLGDYTKTTNKTTGEVTYSIGEELQHFINQCESCNDTNKDGTISAEEKDSVRKVEMNKDGIAFCVPSTSTCDGILGKDGTCYPCKTKKVEIASDSQSGCTANCKDKTGQTTKWVVTGDAYLYCMDKCSTNQFQGGNGTCHDCELEETINGIPPGDLRTLCTSCPNRMMTYDYCSYKRPCEVGQSFRSSINGDCISCDSEKIKSSTDSTNCNACLPTDNNKGRVHLINTNVDQICVPKIQNETGLCSSIDGNYTGIDGTMFRGADGKCYDCTTTQQVKTGIYSEQCKVCGEQRQLDGHYCLINNGCNSGSTFWSVNDQTCIACNTSAIKTETSWDEQNHCDQCSSKRLMILETEDVSKAYCVQKCTTNKWQDIEGNCYACDTNNGKGNIIGMDSASKKLCTDCNRTVAVDDAGNMVCQ